MLDAIRYLCSFSAINFPHELPVSFEVARSCVRVPQTDEQRIGPSSTDAQKLSIGPSPDVLTLSK